MNEPNKNKLATFVVAPLDRPNANNRVYTTELAKKAIAEYKIKSSPMYAYDEQDKVVGDVADMYIKDQNLCVDVEFFEDTPLNINMMGVGKIGDDGVISEYAWTGVSVDSHSRSSEK